MPNFNLEVGGDMTIGEHAKIITDGDISAKVAGNATIEGTIQSIDPNSLKAVVIEAARAVKGTAEFGQKLADLLKIHW